MLLQTSETTNLLQKVVSVILGVTLAAGGYFVHQNDRRVTSMEQKVDKLEDGVGAARERLMSIETDLEHIKKQGERQQQGIDRILEKLEK